MGNGNAVHYGKWECSALWEREMQCIMGKGNAVHYGKWECSALWESLKDDAQCSLCPLMKNLFQSSQNNTFIHITAMNFNFLAQEILHARCDGQILLP
ncbi:hypothetical protein AVEN_147107-1 [Araneus ventricosus]|uniref:Uncharacterized protein n=1 Tax=Araneus ventricosus TaxID=182803 RepID=A0A4Y2J7T6_ARAVE|nr:hypothetical protein AVEN_147107-1 [Araneus ventricosus]